MLAQVGVNGAFQCNDICARLALEADRLHVDVALPMVPECVLGGEVVVWQAICVGEDEFRLLVLDHAAADGEFLAQI